jgi:hypothetical protein
MKVGNIPGGVPDGVCEESSLIGVKISRRFPAGIVAMSKTSRLTTTTIEAGTEHNHTSQWPRKVRPISVIHSSASNGPQCVLRPSPTDDSAIIAPSPLRIFANNSSQKTNSKVPYPHGTPHLNGHDWVLSNNAKTARPPTAEHDEVRPDRYDSQSFNTIRPRPCPFPSQYSAFEVFSLSADIRRGRDGHVLQKQRNGC